MALSQATLSAIQKAGSIVKKLQESIQSEAKKHADKLSKLLSGNPSAFANEVEASELQALKALSKVASLIKAAEDALNEAFTTGSDTEPTQGASSAATPEITFVLEQANAAPAKKTLAVVAPKASKGGNVEKLSKVLQTTLNVTEFRPLNQSEVAKKAGIATGSMTALLKKLISSGRVLTDSNGGYKLGSETAIVQAATSASKPKARAKTGKELPSTQNATTKTRAKKVAAKVPVAANDPTANSSEQTPSETKEAESGV